MSKVLVTGGAGFIGSHVIEKLFSKGYEIVVVDNFVTGRRSNIKSNIKVLDIDINSEKMRNVFQELLPEFVIHLAAQTSVSSSVKSPKKDAQTNIIGTVNLLELCKEFSVKKIIYTSSAAVYGNNEHLPILENYPLVPTSPYGISKLVGENYIKIFNRLHHINYSILRLSNVYGPRQSEKGEAGVVTSFVNQMINGIPPTIDGDGNQRRDFIYVKDVANAIVAAMESPESQTVNISSGESISINNLFAFLAEIMDYDRQPKYGPARVGDIYNSTLSNQFAKNNLKWQPTIDIKKGLRETVDYFLNQTK